MNTVIDVFWKAQSSEWQITAGEVRKPAVFARKADAVRAAKDKALAAGRGVVRVHGTDGRVQKEHHYGTRSHDTMA